MGKVSRTPQAKSVHTNTHTNEVNKWMFLFEFHVNESKIGQSGENLI